ncbi:MAG: T9SS type A sorting domain-containing protein [Crocinitomicaceae bacterium]|nr:T9SS type A sorting domain-containing protein [Crocinitomicaceae bacterium]
MKKGLLFIATLFSGFGFAQDCSELFISEYVEGWSNNKALEIYNPTANPINLNQYFVARYANGATSATTSNAIQLSGTIAPYSTYVAVLDKRDPNGTGQEAPIWDSLEVKADGFYCPVYTTSNAFYWNGNDAVVLAKGTTSNIPASIAVDIFGKIGEDPGTGWSTSFPYTGAGVIVTEDHSMLRKATVLKGVTNPLISFFNPMIEYDTIPAVVVRLDSNGDTLFGSSGNPILDGNWNSLGVHNCNCAPASVSTIANKEEVKLFPNPSNGIVYIKNTEEIVLVEVFNALGQRVIELKNSSKTLLSLDLENNKGVYFVKLTDKNGLSQSKRVVIK